MEFAAPHWFWLLLAAPLAAALAGLLWRRRLRDAARWASRGLWDRLLVSYHRPRLIASTVLLAIAVLGTALALAQPRWGLKEQQVERQGVDLVFVLDTSLSMATRDVQPSRLWVAQTLIRRLVQSLPGHRMALVQAEGDGVVMVPLTVDSAAIDLLLDAVQPGSLPTPGTELRPGLERALDLFVEDGDKHRAVILVSDGEDHGTGLEKAAQKMRDRGVVVHALGVGTPEGKPLEMPLELVAGRQVEYKHDDEGKVVVSRLQEANLESLARETGGVYLRATSAAADLGRLVQRIEAMEKRSFGSELISSLEERFQWPIALAILALLAHLVLSPFRAVHDETAEGAR